MAYDSNNLSALTYANGFTLWHYKTPDAAAAVDTSGYFNEAAGMLRVGDFILTNADTKGVVLVVSANAGGVVETVDITNPWGDSAAQVAAEYDHAQGHPRRSRRRCAASQRS